MDEKYYKILREEKIIVSLIILVLMALQFIMIYYYKASVKVEKLYGDMYYIAKK